MSLELLNDAIVAQLATVPNVATCELYAGQFNAEEIKRSSFTAPALFPVCLGGDEGPDPMTGQTVLKAEFVTFVVAKNARGRNSRKTQAAMLAEHVLLMARRQRWGLDFVTPVTNRRLENLYTPATDKSGMALWAVKWQQDVCLGENTWADECPEITEIFVGMAPNIGTGHEGDYQQVETN